MKALFIAVLFLVSLTKSGMGQFTPGSGGGFVPSSGSQLLGTTTNDSAAAGNVGEYRSAIVLIGSAVTLTTGTAANIVTLSLTAGDWDVSGELWFSTTGATSLLIGSVSQNSGSLPGVPTDLSGETYMPFSSTAIFPIGVVRVSIAATTNVYLVGQANFSSGTGAAYGKLSARRVR